jgi:predicted RNase H-like nuclease
MATFIGIDGIPGGWVAVYLNDDGSHRFAYADRADRLLAVPYDRAMIDVPIGLPDRGYRQCDIEAREIVGSRAFLGARWGVWKFKTLNEANTCYWANGDPGISMQLFCIREKLQEMNETSAPPRLLEAHPELIFWCIAGHVLDRKKSESGRNQRIAILEDRGISKIQRWLCQRHGTGIHMDDLIDACACALAARDNSGNRLPDSGMGPGEIWY